MTRDHLTTNRDIWNADATNWVEFGERLWSLKTPEWGNWGNPDEGLHLLPPDMTGMAAIELGCGTGYVAGWMARRGARVTAIDISAKQLTTARRLAADHGADITFIEGMPKRPTSRIVHSTSRFRNMGHRSGAHRRRGCGKLGDCCVRVGGWCSWETIRFR